MGIDQGLKDVIRDLFELMYPGWTDEDLLLYPRELRHFTRLVETLAGRILGSYEVSGALINERKKGGKKFGKPRKNSACLLELEVKASRVQLTVDKFKKVVTDVFLRDNNPKGAERLMRQYGKSMEFCQNVRNFFGTVREIQMPDTMILRTLVSLRKDGKFRNKCQSVGNDGEEKKALN